MVENGLGQYVYIVWKRKANIWYRWTAIRKLWQGKKRERERMLPSIVLNEFFKQPKLWPSEPGEVVCSKHWGGWSEPTSKNVLESRSCLLNVMKRSLMNHCIPNAAGFVANIIWIPEWMSIIQVVKTTWMKYSLVLEKETGEERGGHIYIYKYMFWECFVKFFPPPGHICLCDSFAWSTLVYCYLKSLFSSLRCAFYGFLLGYATLLEYKKKVKVSWYYWPSKGKISSKQNCSDADCYYHS